MFRQFMCVLLICTLVFPAALFADPDTLIERTIASLEAQFELFEGTPNGKLVTYRDKNGKAVSRAEIYRKQLQEYTIVTPDIDGYGFDINVKVTSFDVKNLTQTVFIKCRQHKSVTALREFNINVKTDPTRAIYTLKSTAKNMMVEIKHKIEDLSAGSLIKQMENVFIPSAYAEDGMKDYFAAEKYQNWSTILILGSIMFLALAGLIKAIAKTAKLAVKIIILIAILSGLGTVMTWFTSLYYRHK